MMPNLIVKKLDGSSAELTATPGQSLMEALRDGGVDDLLAICGGMMSCSTCHVYIADKDKDKLPAISDGERDMLEMSSHFRPESRLSCQVEMTSEIETLHLEIAPED